MKIRHTMVIAAMLVASIPASIFAQTVEGLTLYGQIRAYEGYVRQSKEVTQTGTSDLDFTSPLTSTRLGMKGKYGIIDGLFEIGLNGSGSSYSVITRKAYAVANFSDDLKLKVGQDEAPYTFWGSVVSFDGSFGGVGATNQPRDLQIKISYANAYLAVLNPKAPANITAPVSINAKNWDIVSPKIAIGYDYINSDSSVKAGIGAAYQASKVDALDDPSLADLDKETVNAGLVYAHGTIALGNFSVNLNAGYGINTAILGFNYSGSFVTTPTSAGTSIGLSAGPEVNSSGNGFENTTTIEGYVDAGYKIQSTTIRGGLGYAQAKNSNWDKTDAQIAYFAQAIIPVVEKRFNVIPEAFYFDFLKDKTGEKQGNELAIGILLQVVF